MKLARLWGYREKKICPKDAVVVFAHGNNWGHSMAAISTTSDPFFFRGFEPLLKGLKLVPYNDTCTLCVSELRTNQSLAYYRGHWVIL